MNDRQRRRFERLARVSNFGASVSGDFPATGKGGQAHARLAAAVAAAGTHDTARATNQRERQQSTGARKDTRLTIQTSLAAISNTADTIALDHPEVKDSFRRPRTNINDQTLLSTARSFAAAALPLKARFIEYEMPTDFLEQLDKAISGFEQSVNRQTSGASAGLASNAALENTLKQGEQELEKFDTAVRNKFRDDPAKLAAWESARRLEKAPRSPRSKATPPSRFAGNLRAPKAFFTEKNARGGASVAPPLALIVPVGCYAASIEPLTSAMAAAIISSSTP